jgi:hypothetical protein
LIAIKYEDVLCFLEGILKRTACAGNLWCLVVVSGINAHNIHLMQIKLKTVIEDGWLTFNKEEPGVQNPIFSPNKKALYLSVWHLVLNLEEG